MDLSSDRKKLLEQKRIDIEMKINKDKSFIVLLMTFGISLLLIASASFLVGLLNNNPALLAIDGIGFFLLIAGSFWHYLNEKSLRKVEDELNDIKSKEEQGYRFGSEN